MVLFGLFNPDLFPIGDWGAFCLGRWQAAFGRINIRSPIMNIPLWFIARSLKYKNFVEQFSSHLDLLS